MQDLFSKCSKVCEVVNKFANKLHGEMVADYRTIQFALALLCKAKGKSRVLADIETELELHGVSRTDIESSVLKIREIAGEDIDDILPISADMVIEKFYSFGPWGEYLQPKELSNLILTLIKGTGCRTIYNPFAGLGSYALASFVDQYYAQDIDFASVNIAKMRLDLYGKDYSNFLREDSIHGWDDKDAQCIVATPPFGLKLDDEIKAATHASSAEEFLLSKFITSKARYGFFVVARGVCFKAQGTAFDLRKDICDKHMLQMVINLPSGIFSSSGVSTSLIVLCKENTTASVKFIDAEKLFYKEKRSGRILDVNAILTAIDDSNSEIVYNVSFSEMYRSNCSFDAAIYSYKNLVAGENQQIVPLSKILSPSKGIKCSLIGETLENVVSPTDFTDDIFRFEDVHNQSILIQPVYKFHGPHFVINNFGKIYLHRGDSVFYVHASLLNSVFTVNEDIADMEYVAMKVLQDKYIQNLSYGSVGPRISHSQFLKCKIVIDNLDKQKEIVAQLKSSYFESEKKRLGIREAGGDLTHMLGMPKDKIGNLIDMLMLSENIPSEEKKWVKAIDDNFRYMLRLVNTVGVDFSSISITPHVFTICDFIQDYLSSLKNLKFSNNYMILEDITLSNQVYVDCDEDLLRVVLDSAFRNAYTHGFEQKYSDSNKVKLGCKLVEYNGSNYVCLSIANNGAPLANDFTIEDYITRGKKAGKMGNTGKGGYHIHAIVKKFNGYINISSSKEWSFILDVLIPSLNMNSNEIIEYYGSKCI